MIRLVLIVISLLLFFVFSVILWPIEWLVGKISPHARDISRLRIVQGYLHILLFLAGTKVTLLGYEQIPRDEPVLYIMNHRSAFDIAVTLAKCPGITGYISKKEYAKIPLLNWWIIWLHGFFLDRENIKEGLKTILAAIDAVKNGISIAIFPEGTRGRGPDERELLPFHEGSFKIATKTGCPIVPVAINHTSEIFEDHLPWIHSSHVTVSYGTPIRPQDLAPEERKFIGRHVQGIIEKMLRDNH